ncbi:MAG: hypothetical protein SFW09_12715 [Hyphomicrobiaceae bacterium]|nr:hypothetical protein [Hyphomicrobiaceae bacterium]
MLEQVGDGDLSRLVKALGDHSGSLLTLVAVVSLAALVRRLLVRHGNSGVAAWLWTTFTTNWQLALLGTAAALLSLASGWRTWDGMQNFTGEPVASLLMTFGIQAVMLIIAWLIGESFASGLRTRRTGDGGAWSKIEPAIGGIVGVLCAIGVMAAIANAFGAFDSMRSTATGRSGWTEVADKALYFGVGLLILATLLINHRSDVVQPYLQSARLIAKNAMLWVMFLLCMGAGVFFSFDSFFNSIFPQSERARSADIRSQRQVAGVVNDIGALAFRRQAEEAELLFKSSGWAAYERNLAELSRASQGAELEIERYFVERMEAHKSAMAAQQERIATAKGGQASLTSRKIVLTDELARLKGERPALAAELAEKKSELDTRARGIDAKRVEMMAEEKGAEGTLKAGKGPVFRQRKGELDQLQDALKIQEERVRDAQKRIAASDGRIMQIEREVALIDADLAKLKGEADTAEQRIQVAEATKSGDTDTPKVDPARVRSAFERAHGEFRQEPTVEKLNALATQCTQLLTAMASTPATKDRVRTIDCDPKQATEAASRVFALNVGLVTFAQSCSGGAKLPQTGGTDALLAFGRKCLQDSGLPTKDSSEMAARISAIDLNRDDKAHRFVVTWNAFLDGNRLAYLSLAIAIALDSLIFMAGLFGANAVRSPLTEIDDHGDMTADQLEAAIDATLAETIDARGTIAALLGAMHPVRKVDGFASEIVLDEREPLIDEMRKVLNAGSNISAVRPVGDDRTRYLLHAGFTRYLTLAQRKPWKVKTVALDRKELVNVIGVALLPEPHLNAEIVLSEMHPISDAQGFAAETSPFKIEDQARRRLVLNTLGAGATVQGAVKRENETGRYFVSTDFYKTLLLMRAAAIPAFRPDVVRARYAIPPQEAAAAPRLAAARPDALPTHLEAGPVPQLTDRLHVAPAQAPRMPDAEAPHHAPRPAGPSVPVVPPPLPAEVRPLRASDGPPATPRAAERQRPPLRPEMQAQAGPPPHESSLGDDIRSDIIHLAGLHAWSDREIGIARQLGAESEPEQALKRLAGRAPRLARLVGDTIDDNRSSLREAYEHLRAHHSGDAMYNQVLETVAIELDELMPILMLTPGGPYQQILDRLIYDLESQAGEGTLGPAETTLLNRARAQVGALKGLSDSANDRYMRIVRIIDQYDERTGSGLPPLEQIRAIDKRAAG